MNTVMVTIEVNGKHFDGPMKIPNIRIRPHKIDPDSILINLGKNPPFMIHKSAIITLKFEEN